ncbi:bifunctional diguanylate cyclase/phosphodiesterase [Methylophaga nitratireducenticrescens]|uniref:cyclic-guanylate-specific phosphodiesterase n=1 Tax=Methylophaga nitratireducenticrescens TaxID=754476 RepID=I1XKK8_METNJ|nr:bifunctional diguanylate cyclase/phosphodiesterase [Methylophaga nitratireducenticrescens]AUZ84941.1 bifunctional diguanylate cyclase/phosphodiesterase [Methylophaga nitratireducenticrescens]
MINGATDTPEVAIIKFCLHEHNQIKILDSTSSITNVFGFSVKALIKNPSLLWSKIFPEDRVNILQKLNESAQTMQPLNISWRLSHPLKGEVLLDCKALPETDAEAKIVWHGYFQDITELKRVEQENQVHLHFLECLDQVNRAIQGTNDLEQMMSDVLAAILLCFECDRAWLLYPCDPTSATWHIPMEQTHPDFPGGLAAGVDFSMTKEAAVGLEAYLSSKQPVTLIPDLDCADTPEFFKEHQIRSIIGTAIYPKTGKPWVFGLHQCSYGRVWTDNEKRLFSEIGHRLSDGLTSLLIYREQRESDERFRQAFEFAAIGMGILSLGGQWLRANHSIYEMFGYSETELLKMTYQEMTHPDDLPKGQAELDRLIADQIPYMQIEKRYRHQNGKYFWARLTTSIVRGTNNQPLYFVSQIENIEKGKKSDQSIALLNFAINQVKECIYLLDRKGRIRYVNDETCHTMGYHYDELLTMSVPEVDPNISQQHWNEHWQELKQERSVRLETHHKTKTGRIIPVEVNANYFEYGGIGYNLALTHDITERKAVESALREQEERFRQLADNIEEVVWLTDLMKGHLLYISPAYQKIWGHSCDSLYEKPSSWLEIIHPEDINSVRQALVNGKAVGEYDIEFRIIRLDGTIRHIHQKAFPILNESGELYRIAGTAQDITERKEQEAHIEYLAYHDSLTALPNRLLTMDRLEHAITHAIRHTDVLAVLFLDLDRFKTINDSLGHQAGDLLLQQVGSRLLEVLRQEDTIGRVGGDEFLILLPSINSPDDAAHVANKLLDVLSPPFMVMSYQLHVNASIGISLCPRDAVNAETLVKYADTALYLAKEQGRGVFRFFSPELDDRVHARLQLENDLRVALENNELYLHYQPLMDLNSGECIGTEALLRWLHPEIGSISPGDFIPVAEETGLILPIGDWVLRTACIQAKKWFEAGITNFRMAVNLSRRQLDNAGLATDIKRILDETECPAYLLELEVTESSAMQNPEQAIVILNSLHEMGICLALDDYGTGYSSLAYLKRFPFDRLKIDRSFIDGIPDDADDMSIVQTTIILARQLRLTVIAEGVETQAQCDFLKKHQCDEIQGYLFAKPMPADELEKRFGFGKLQLG